jgi:hypothetical protein
MVLAVANERTALFAGTPNSGISYQLNEGWTFAKSATIEFADYIEGQANLHKWSADSWRHMYTCLCYA